MTTWTTDDFDKMSWHDVHVHGFQIVENESGNGTAELIFDIDYILEWRKGEGKFFSFVVAQASLQFHQIFGLKFELDYVKPTSGMCAFSIDGIVRERIEYRTGQHSYKWKLPINWPTGKIEFESPGFTQKLVGEPRLQEGQSLNPSERSTNSEF